MTTAVQTSAPPSLLTKMAQKFSVAPDRMLTTLKATAFKGDVSNEQMIALLIVADQYGLNPWTKEIYAFPDRQNGIVPVIGVDGWSRIINSHDQFDGMTFETDDEGCTCTIYRKDRAHPIQVTEYMSECKRDVGPWKSHPRRMLRHKAMIQCARLAFGFVGVYDQDEAERIVERDITAESEVLPASDKPQTSRTEAVKDKLKARQQKAPAADPAQQQGMTFAQVDEALQKATTAEELDTAADLIGSVENPEHRAELSAIYKARAEQVAT